MIEHLIHTLQSLKIGLKVVDGSLKINAPKGVLTPEIIESIKTHKSGLIALLSSSETIPQTEEKDYYVLTSSQERLWTLSQFEAGSTAYNIFNTFEFKGVLDIDKLSLAFLKLIERHESLRTVFKEDAQGTLGQYIIPIEDYTGTLRFVDLSNTTDQALKDHSDSIQGHHFDLEKGPLFIGEIVKVSDEQHIMMFNMHHIIGDGWSMEVLNKEFALLYNGLSTGEEALLPELPIQYKDYSEWQNSDARQTIVEKSKTFWLDTFAGDLPVLELPSNTMRPKVKTYNGSSLDYTFSKEFTSLLNTYAQQNGVTLFMVLMTGINGLLSRYANTRDIILGTPIAGREHADLENQVGLYLNTLAIRTTFEETSSFEELLAIQKETLLQAYSHQEYPFDSLVEELNIKRDLSRSVLFDALVVFQNQQELLALDGLTLNGLEISSYKEIEKTFSKFDVSFVFSEVGGRIYLNLGYNTDIYTFDFIEQIIAHLENFLEIGVSNPKAGINTIDFLLEEEKQQLLIDFNATQTTYPKEETVIDLFLNQVHNTPDAIAIQCEGKEITYRELDTLSNELASYVTSNYTVSKGQVISIQLEKSEWFIISILAVLKTGNAYLPIDVDYPEERISFITSDSKCSLTIDETLITTFRASDIESLDEFTVVSSEISDVMYVIYTSGSTGKPKGVLVTYGSLINYISHQFKTYDLGKSERILQFSNLAFDASVEQVFLALLHGASLVIVSKDQIIDTPNFTEVLKDNEITHFHATPSYISKIERLESCTDIKRIICGGEPCPKELADALSMHVDFYNKYGPTETTISSTIYKYDRNNCMGQSVPIGKPIANTEIYILSNTLEVQPIGVIGELCIAGDGVSNGYLNKPALTAESFVENRFRESGNLYKTGDLAKWLPDGTIEYIGRKDDQVKIRGYRIELGEIENNLIGIASIHQAVVVDRTIDGEKTLVAYITGEKELNKQAIRAALSTELPEYMIPSYYVVLDSIPLTAHGKVDKRALPKIAQEDILKREYVAPSTTIEKQLVPICEEVLKVDTIGVTDNFFELGGHSLKMILIVNKIKKELGLELSVKDIFLYPTIEGMASQVKRSTHTSIPKAIAQESYVLTSSQHRLWVLSQFEEGNVAYNIPGVYELKGDINIDLFTEAFSVLIERHESLRTCFRHNDQEEVRQYILPLEDLDITIHVDDLTDVEDQDGSVTAIINDNYTHCFDLSKAPLITSSFIKLASDHYVLMLNMHHIISDGWSMEVLSKEFLMIYNGLQRGEQMELPVLSIQYKDYSEWLAGEAQQSKLSASEAYWVDTFSGELPILELPTYKARPRVKTYHGDSVTHQFSENLSTQLHAFSEEQGVSLFMLLMSGVNGLLSRYTNTQDIVLGTPVAGRGHADLENQIGLYLNTLAIRTSFGATTSFEELLAIQKDALLSAYSHQEYPFDSLVEALKLQRDTSRSALFDVIVVLQNQQDLFSSKSMELEGLEIQPYTGNHRKVSQFDLSFIFSEGDGQLSLHIEYNTDIYELGFIESLLQHLENFLSSSIQDASQRVSKVHYLNESEEQQLLQEFNNTEVLFSDDKTLVDAFTDQVKETPNAVAIVFGEKEITYKELDTLSNEFAHYLLSNYTLNIEDLIGVKLDRSEWLIISLLAVLKSGCAYVPMDTSYPAQRIDYIERDSNCKVTIDDNLVSAFARSSPISNKLPVISLQPNNLAYVIYTSGSTGEPKGVMITHSSASAMLHWSIREFQNTDFNILYAVTSHCFDLSVYELFYPLSIGKQIRLLENGLAVSDYITEDRKVLINTVPSVVQALLDRNVSFDHVVAINLAGEAFPMKLAEHFQDSGIAIRNLYGPSEDTTYSSCQRVVGPYERSVPIGKPIDGTQFYILSEELAAQPIGVAGEICISGDGLSRGYLHNPALTEEKFIDHPFLDGKKLYKTGDLGRWLEDGTVEYLGRKDNQVKIRGYRIELGEIEHAVQLHKDIDTNVIAVNNVYGSDAIVCYFVSKKTIDKQALRSSLSRILPEYMLPSYFIALEEIPLTPNGKIDKKALPVVDTENIVKKEYVAPSNQLEEKLVAIWEEVLGIDKIGVEDDFFILGGHSLKVTLIVNKIKKELGLEVSVKDMFLHPTISGILTQVKKGVHVAIPKAKEQDSYVLTSSQYRLWALSQFKEGSAAYNIPIVFQLKGTIHIDLFTEAFRRLIERHESLRTCFKDNGQGEIRQYILPSNSLKVAIAVHDLTQAKNQDVAVSTMINDTYTHCFDLSKAPLITSNLIQLATEDHLLVLNMHHIISDGWSMEVMSREFMMLYNALLKGEDIVLPKLSIQYKDYSEWLAGKEQQAKMSASEAYWLDKFSGELPIVNLPSWKTRPPIKTYNGDYFAHTFSKEFSEVISSFSEKNHVSEFMVIMAALNGMFSRYTNTSDIILGTPMAGRDHTDLEHQIGLYLNTLAIRTAFDKNVSFETLLEIQKRTLLDAYTHQEYPFDTLVDALHLQRDTSRSALFDIMVVFQNQQNILGEQDLHVEGLEISGYTNSHRNVSQFDVSLVFSKQNDDFSLQVEYNTDIYELNFIEKLCVHLENFLLRGIKNPTQNIQNIQYLSVAEETQVLVDFNVTSVDCPEATMVDLFVAQATKTPEKIAMVVGVKEFTYRELDEMSNKLTNYLLDQYDVKQEDLIGVKLDRDEWLFISLLAVLKTGSAYVPMDISYPAQRIAYIENDSKCKITIDVNFISAFIKEKDISKKRIAISLKPEGLAYVIYTSGSTGEPKGVMITHSSASAMLHWSIREFQNTDFNILYAVTSHCFDLSVYELFYPLSIGKQIRLLENGLAVSDYITEDRKVLINTVPSVVQALLDRNVSFDHVVAINLAGEAFPMKLAEHFQDSGIAIRNLYGPSEDTTYSSCQRVVGPYERSVPIGKPIDGTQFYILSEELAAQPIGVAGEICISGDGLSRGYLHNPALTEEKFIDHPFLDGKKLYKTGDLGRWLEDGTVEYLGRKDNQVKIRGYRIELGEIEHAVQLHKDIDTNVIAVNNVYGSDAIVCYFVSKKTIDKQALRSSLSRILPEYMLPSYFIALEEIPLTPNGKIDKKALPVVDTENIVKKEYVAPSNQLEEKLVAIWEEVLGIDKIGVEDDFFILGGHSLKALSMVFLVQKNFNIKIELEEVYKEPTISNLADYIESMQMLSSQLKTTMKGEELIF